MIPLRTDRRLRHTPWVNLALILVNAAVFLATRRQFDQMHLIPEGTPLGSLAGQFPVREYFLNPASPTWWQYVTYQFLHNDWQHLLFNMLFLYVFGNSLEDRLGPVGYLFFYLAGGVVAGIGHSASSMNPVIGASGAVAAVTGGFLALFPLSHVTILWPFIFIFITEWPSMYFILLAFARDLFSHFSGGGNVAYLAHISGNVYGFAIGMTLLATRILPREKDYDFLALASHWNRRRKYRAMVAQGPGPWQADAANAMGQRKLSEPEEKVMRLRSAVQLALREQRYAEALSSYSQLLGLEPRQVLPRDTQLDIAAHAMQAGLHPLAAAACEAFLRAYPADADAPEVQLMLGVLFVNYLNEPSRARVLLEQARDRHADPSRRALAADLLGGIA